METILNTTAGVFGIISGILWFLAAKHTPTPSIGAYYDVTDSPDSHFAGAWKEATRANQYAAIATGISAFLFGLAGLWHVLSHLLARA